MKESSTRRSLRKRNQKVGNQVLLGTRRESLISLRHARKFISGADYFGLRAMRRAFMFISRVDYYSTCVLVECLSVIDACLGYLLYVCECYGIGTLLSLERLKRNPTSGERFTSFRLAVDLYGTYSLAGIIPIFYFFRARARATHSFRDRLKVLCDNQVRSPSHVPFPNIGDADPPTRRTVHQRASDEVTGAMSSITRPTVPNNNNWQIPSHVMNTIIHSTHRAASLPDDSITTWEDLQSQAPKEVLSTLQGGLPKKLDPFIPHGPRRALPHGLGESFALAEQQRPSTRTSIPSARTPASSVRGVHQVTPDTSMAAPLATMTKEIKELKLSAQKCEVCRP
ncbi:hypothetical protein L1987_86081 [Smallanthus sonchifolius]|uniref:Uncharacterized protein n=1 Tax=Smallanthus sonchifolius TaxID=185202 RepID=A0ACB8XXT1_9ASTR|nr:hypothetical protein L1987_86081 [Smallanthus sonchifolius]